MSLSWQNDGVGPGPAATHTDDGMKQDCSSMHTGRHVSVLAELHADPLLSVWILLSFLSLQGAMAEPCTAQPAEISEPAYARAYVPSPGLKANVYPSMK